MSHNNVTFFTTNSSHWDMVLSPFQLFVSHKINPLIFMPCEFDLFPYLKVTKLPIKYLLGEPFEIFDPMAHIQMQDRDVPHCDLITNAQQHNIPTYIIQHGLVSHTPERIIENADYLFVWSESEKRKITSIFPEDRIFVVGNPRYDNIAQHPQDRPDNILITTRPWITTDGSVPDLNEDISRFFVDRLEKIIKANPTKTFFFRKHPSSFDNIKFYDKIIRLENVKVTSLECYFFYVLSECNILISYPNSSTQPDAACNGVPVISLDTDFDITEEIHRIGNGESPRCYQYDDIPRDKLAGERIVETIMERLK